MSDHQNKLTELLFPKSQDQPQIGLGTGLRGGLASAFSLGDPLPVSNIYYHAKQVTVDGYRFIGCRFDKCTLVVQSTNFVFQNCIIDPSCVIQYGGSLVKVIQLFTSRYDWMADHLPGLSPTKHADGTISIGA